MIPAAPSPEVTFNPPPGWTAPAGFDPRRGHPVDPQWPAPPADWQFWVPAPRPRGIAALKAGWWGPIVLVTALGVVVAIAVSAEPGSPTEGLGSCWASDGGSSQMAPVDCGSDRAEYRVDRVVTDASQCSSSGYFEVGNRVECLVPVG